jgi:metallophosphoesterase (TIGR00282 family)
VRFAFFGDVVGRSGRKAVTTYVPRLRDDLKLDAVIVNAENMAGGFGVTRATCDALFDAGVDVLTLGNHSFDNPAGISVIDNDERLLRPCNYPKGQVPGRGAGLYDIGGYRILVINVMGRVFMEALDDPFIAVRKELDAAPLGMVADAVIVDIHAEATSEKQGMGYFCDGDASLVVGTHTHTPTADARILPQGTAFQTDAGMCGDYNSIIGMEPDEPLRRFTTRMRGARFQPAGGEATLSGVFVETDNTTGLALRVEPIRMGGLLTEHMPQV